MEQVGTEDNSKSNVVLNDQRQSPNTQDLHQNQQDQESNLEQREPDSSDSDDDEDQLERSTLKNYEGQLQKEINNIVPHYSLSDFHILSLGKKKRQKKTIFGKLASKQNVRFFLKRIRFVFAYSFVFFKKMTGQFFTILLQTKHITSFTSRNWWVWTCVSSVFERGRKLYLCDESNEQAISHTKETCRICQDGERYTDQMQCTSFYCHLVLCFPRRATSFSHYGVCNVSLTNPLVDLLVYNI